MAINTLLCDSVNEETLIKVLQWHIKYLDFDVLRVPLSEESKGEETECDSFFFAFIKSQKHSVKIIQLMKERLMSLSFEEINALVEEVNSLGIQLTEPVNNLLGNLKKEMIKNRKLPSLFLHIKLK